MEIKIIDLQNQKNEQILIEGIKKNIETAKFLRGEIKRLTPETSQDFFLKGNEKPPMKVQQQKKEQENPEFIDAVNEYFAKIKKIKVGEQPSDSLRQKFINSLPPKSDYHYTKIVLRIETELLKEMIEIKNFLESEKQTIAKEDLDDFKEEILQNQKKIEWIENIRKEIENVESKEEENQLYFLSTESGNICVFDDLSSISSEYYKGFIELFVSIIKGRFKNVKQFANNSELAGIKEVKDFKIRILFDKIGQNQYVILGAFIKKSDNDNGYQDKLKTRVNLYYRQKEKILGLKDFEDEKAYQEQLKKPLLQALEQKEKPRVYKRGEYPNGNQ